MNADHSTLNIIDTHLHLWDPSRLRYPWLDDNEKLNRSFSLDDYRMATESITVEKMVFVQCECIFSQCEEEAAWVTQLAKEDKRIRGIVPLAPLENNNVVEVLERYSTNALIKGIRRIIQFEADQQFCLRPEFVNGVRLLKKFDFSFDICINHTQLPQVIKLVSECEGVKFILDHVGKPDIKNGNLLPWRKNIEELSKFPNVFCKISGLVTEADLLNWNVSDLKPYVDHVLLCFGLDRVMFGGDWPVVLQASTFQRWFEASMKILSHLRSDELNKIYHDNAIKFYRLN